MKKPRLSYYSYDSLGNPWVSGGGAVRDWEVLKRFAQHADVTLWVGKYPGFQAATREGIHIQGLGGGKTEGFSRLAFSLVANLRVLLDRAEAIGNSASIYAPILTGVFRRSRFYGVYHHLVGWHSRDRYGVLGWIPWLMEQWMLRFGLHYVISNAAVAEKIHSMNPKACVFTTFNGFDALLLSLPHQIISPPFILFLGRFDVYMKGLDLLIPAYTAVAAPRGIDLVLAGRAPKEVLARVRALITESARARVRVEIEVTEKRKAELLSSCLFFCSPSRFEGFGIAALEANAAGKAVLATDVDGFRDSLVFGETALAAPPENLEALKSAMIRLIEDADLRERLGRQGRKRAGAFSWDAIAEKEWGWIQQINPSRLRNEATPDEG